MSAHFLQKFPKPKGTKELITTGVKGAASLLLTDGEIVAIETFEKTQRPEAIVLLDGLG